MNKESTTNLSDLYESCYAETLVLQTKMTMGITPVVIDRYLTLSQDATWMLDNSEPDWWSDEELEGIQAILSDIFNIGTEVREWIQEQIDETEEMDGG